MRTTLTLEDDVAARLRLLRDREGRSLKDLVNELLRRGLDAEDHEHPTIERDFTQPQDLGGQRVDVDDVSEALAVAEGDHAL